MIYDLLAPFYDRFNGEIDYEKWADFVEENIRRYYLPFFGQKPELGLDLCCGTGRMTFPLAARGYDMTGVDYSTEMLDFARKREAEMSLPHEILWLCQDAREFELYGTVDFCVCCLDSINHLCEKGDLEKTLSLVHNYLIPDGLFLFDINGEKKFSEVYGDRSYVFEQSEKRRDAFCVWQNGYRKKSGLCDFYITLFCEGKDGRYDRFDEIQTERVYTVRRMKKALADAGFELLSVSSDFDFTDGSDRDLRLYFAARCKKPACEDI